MASRKTKSIDSGEGGREAGRTSPPRPASSRARQQRAIDARDSIIDAAEAEFAKRGFDGVSNREIAKRAGVQHTMIPYYFENKDGLWQAVFDRISGEFVTSQKERLAGLRGVNHTAQLKLLMEDFIRYSASNLNLHKLMTLAASESSPRLDDIIARYLREYFEMMADLIEKSQAEGNFIPGDPNHLHYLFIGAATRIFMQSAEVIQVMGVSPTSPDFVDQHIERCLSLFFHN